MLSTDMEAIKKKKTQMKFLEALYLLISVWDTLGGVDGRLDNAEEKTG